MAPKSLAASFAEAKMRRRNRMPPPEDAAEARDFVDADSQSALSAAATAVARALGRRAAREHVAQTTATPKGPS